MLHPINTRDATIAALSDAQYVAPLVHTGDMLSQPKSSTSSADDRKERGTKSFFYVFDYQTRDGDYPQVSAALSLLYCISVIKMSNERRRKKGKGVKVCVLPCSC